MNQGPYSGRMSVGGHTVDETPLGCLLSMPDEAQNASAPECVSRANGTGLPIDVYRLVLTPIRFKP